MNSPNGLKYAADHEWVCISDNEAVIGITSSTQSGLGGIVYVDADAKGERVERNGAFGSIEVVKAVSDLMMSMAGEVLEVNEELEDTPELVNEDPYGKDWIIRIAITSLAKADELLGAASYQEKVSK